MHLIIVEDLSFDQEKLADLIRQDCAGHEESVDLSFYASGEDFLAHYRPKSCDGLFLDIVLGGLTGIEVARRVREKEPYLPIIFTTTERDYAVDGFAVRGTDYLIKPLDPAQVARCMERLREFLAVPSSISLLETSGRGHSAPVEIPLDDILYAQCFDHIIQVKTIFDVYRTRQSFQDIAATLPHTGRFYVCGRGLAVNLSYVERVLEGELLLKNGDRLSFSRSRKQDVQKSDEDWSFTRSRKGGWAR
ncbi:MAG: LytTR family DNA-binding domain-containing protein [Dysosmobacter sp.]|nr:LytTR family DNA-binding domain-containing protein [Dysosmobacter sp.]